MRDIARARTFQTVVEEGEKESYEKFVGKGIVASGVYEHKRIKSKLSEDKIPGGWRPWYITCMSSVT